MSQPAKATTRRAAAETTTVCEVEMGGGRGEEKKGSVLIRATDPTAPIQSLYIARSVTVDPAKTYRVTVEEIG